MGKSDVVAGACIDCKRQAEVRVGTFAWKPFGASLEDTNSTLPPAIYIPSLLHSLELPITVLRKLVLCASEVPGHW